MRYALRDKSNNRSRQKYYIGKTTRKKKSPSNTMINTIVRSMNLFFVISHQYGSISNIIPNTAFACTSHQEADGFFYRQNHSNLHSYLNTNLERVEALHL
jgi:hypothetical protein